MALVLPPLRGAMVLGLLDGSALNNTKKKEMTADQYFTKMQGFVSELGAAGISTM
jgi:hypothetical protein